jgi:hypothetical protein
VHYRCSSPCFLQVIQAALRNGAVQALVSKSRRHSPDASALQGGGGATHPTCLAAVLGR